MRKDLQWWEKFLPQFSRVSLLWHMQLQEPDAFLASDSSLIGIGATCQNEYLFAKFPKHILSKTQNITHLEFMAILVALKTWIPLVKGKFIVFSCDNLAVVHCINSGAAHDPFLLQELRELSWLSSTNDFYIRAVYIKSEQNVVPDLLSCWFLSKVHRKKFHQLNKSLKLSKVNVACDSFSLFLLGNCRTGETQAHAVGSTCMGSDKIFLCSRILE